MVSGHLCQRQLHSVPCKSADLLHLSLWDHKAVDRSVSWDCMLRGIQKEATFSYNRDELQHCLCHVANDHLSPCVTCYVRAHKLVLEEKRGTCAYCQHKYR